MSKFNLIDCSTGDTIQELKDGDVLDRALLPQDITIEAVTVPDEIGEVQFYLDGALVEVEKKLPYSLSSNYGDGSFKPSDQLEPSDQVRTLKAIPIWWWGFEGETLEVSFTVIRSSRRLIRGVKDN